MTKIAVVGGGLNSKTLKNVVDKMKNQKSEVVIINSSEPCEYCIDAKHTNCSGHRTEFFPHCFKGKKVQVCDI